VSRPRGRYATGGVSLRRRVAVSFLGIAGLGLLALGFTAWTFSSLLDARNRMLDRIDPAVVAARDLRNALLTEESGVRGYVLAGDEAFLEPYTRGRAEKLAAVARLEATIGSDRRLATALHDAVQRAVEWRLNAAEPLIESVRANGPKAATPELLDESKRRFEAFRSASTAFQQALAAESNLANDRLDTATRRLVQVAAVGVVGAALGGLALWRALARWVLRPLDSLGEQTREVTAGQFDRPIEPVGPPEIMAVAADTEAMRRRIRSEFAAVEQARELLAVKTDELAAQADELARSNADLEQFAYVASHDLQEPLRKVTSFCQLLQRRYQGELDERADQYIEFAVDGAKRMQQLINDLLAFSRVGRTTEAFVEVDCDEVVDRALRNLEPAIEDAGADVVRCTSLPKVQGDPTLLTALFQNVISNAIKFRSDDPPRVEVSATEADGEWSFRVADNGIGIDEAYAERVFVIFQRLHAKELYPGTGIGLALCKKIVEFHGGRIWIDTTVPAGTTVCWTLPVPQDEDHDEGEDPVV
jgi:signal transduction histidine kinase